MLNHYNSLHHSFHFANTEMMEIFLFQIFKEVAFGLINIFVPIYLLTSGVSLTNIILIFTLRSATHGILALLLGRITLFRVGIKHTFTITTILYILSFIVIKQGVTLNWIVAWILITGTANALYSCAHHSFLTLKVDELSAGKEIAVLSIISMLVGIVMPFLGAVMIFLFGFKDMFLVGSVFLFISIIPLFLSKEIDTSGQINLKGFSHLREFWISKRKIALSAVGGGFNGSSDPLWDSLYLYKLVGGIKILGGLTSVISFIQMISHYISGKRVDENKSGFKIGILGSIFARLLTFVSFNPYIAIMSETVNGIIRPLFSTAYSASFYKTLRGPYALSYVAAHETTWHIAHVFAMIFVIIGTYFFGWYAFLVTGVFMLIGNLIFKSQGVGAQTSLISK